MRHPAHLSHRSGRDHALTSVDACLGVRFGSVRLGGALRGRGTVRRHSWKPPTRSVACGRPSWRSVAAARLELNPSLQTTMTRRAPSLASRMWWGLLGSRRHSRTLRSMTFPGAQRRPGRRARAGRRKARAEPARHRTTHQRPSARPGRYENIAVRFTVKGDAPAEMLREIVEQSRARSAVFDVITNRVPVTIDVTTD